MEFPRRDDATAQLFEACLPEDPGVKVRPMFGQRAAFVNGNMFACTLGTQLVVRLGAKEREALLKEEGASVFEPVKGRKMGEYVVLPGGWRSDPARVRGMVSRSLSWAKALPPKPARGKPPARRSAAARPGR